MSQENSRSLTRLRRETQLGDISAIKKLLRDATRRDSNEDLFLIGNAVEQLFQQAAEQNSEEDLLSLIKSLILSQEEQPSAQMLAAALRAARAMDSPEARSLLIATEYFCKKSDGDAALQRLNRAPVFDGTLSAARIRRDGWREKLQSSGPIPEEEFKTHRPPFSGLRIVTGGLSIGLNGYQEGLLANLEWVRGDLTIKAEHSNATLTLPRLRRIEGALIVNHICHKHRFRTWLEGNKQRLERIELPQLCSVERIVFSHHSQIELYLPSLPHPFSLHNHNAHEPSEEENRRPKEANFAITNTGPDKRMEVLLEALGHLPQRIVVGWLHQISPEQDWIPLYPGMNRIGRSKQNDIVINQDMCAWHHCAVHYHDGHFTLHDIGSCGGTFLNGEKILRYPFMVGDRLLVGSFIFKIKIRDLDQAKTQEPDTQI